MKFSLEMKKPGNAKQAAKIEKEKHENNSSAARNAEYLERQKNIQAPFGKAFSTSPTKNGKAYTREKPKKGKDY